MHSIPITTPTTANAALEAGRHERDVRVMLALEAAQLSCGIAALAAIGIRAAIVNADSRMGFALAAVVLLVLSYVALVFRVRLGRAMTRRRHEAIQRERAGAAGAEGRVRTPSLLPPPDAGSAARSNEEMAAEVSPVRVA